MSGRDWLALNAAGWERMDEAQRADSASRERWLVERQARFRVGRGPATLTDPPADLPAGHAYHYRDPFGGTFTRFNSGGLVDGAPPVARQPYWLGAREACK